MLVNMKEILEIAEKEQYAIPCINTPNVETIRAVIGAAEELNTPIIIDHAQVHDPLIPIERIGPEMLKYAKAASVPVCVHLDHGSDYDFVLRALKVGFPSIMYDCSALPYEENLKHGMYFKFFAAYGIANSVIIHNAPAKHPAIPVLSSFVNFFGATNIANAIARGGAQQATKLAAIGA